MNIWNFICSTFQTPEPISCPVCLINGTHLHWADVIFITFEPRAVITSAAPNPEHHRVQPVTRFPMIHWLQRPAIRRTKYHLCSVLNQQNTAIDWSPQIANTVWSPLGNKDVFVRALISLSCLQCSEGTLVACGSPGARRRPDSVSAPDGEWRINFSTHVWETVCLWNVV